MAVKKILIVEDQALVRMYLCSCVEKSKECEVAGTLTRADAALQRCGEGHIDLILMDICTENDSDGLTAAEAIKKFYPRIKIVMVTSMLEGRFLDRARRIGADSFWYKDPSEDILLEIMDRTMAGESIYPDTTPMLKLGMASSIEFTPRELEVLRELTSGDTDDIIAERLHLSVHTVKKHIKNMFQKTGFTSRTQLAVMARESGLVIRGF